ncbi:MAG: S-layer homology domain-containing protein [Desulfocucumaceae bacterium]
MQIFRYDEAAGQWVPMGGSYDAGTGTINYITNHFSKYALMEAKQELPAVGFSDIGGHWAEKEILAMAARGIVRGTGGRAMPEDKVTRAQFSTFLVLLLGISGNGSDLPFTDADKSAWYYQSLSNAYGAGLVKGYGNGLIGPNDLITREQVAVMVVEAVKYSGKALPAAEILTFSDTAMISAWASGPVSVVKSLGIISGYPDNTFRPGQNATRAEALVILSGLKL